MRSQFKGYLPLPEGRKREIVKSALIVLDTNVLLDLYRYRLTTSELYLDLLEQVLDRLWIPHHVGWEFFKNRAKVRAEATKGHRERIKLVESWLADIRDAERRSHVGNDEAEVVLIAALNSYVKHLEDEQKVIDEWSNVSAPDKILERILNLFDGRVGSEPDEEWTKKATAEGKRRADSEVPPGFKDSGNKGSNKYGDYFVWQQTIEHAKDSAQDVLMVTGDVKEDWWLRVSGRTLGPLPALPAEFHKLTGHQIHLYDAKRFFEVLSETVHDPARNDSEWQSAKDDIAELQNLRRRMREESDEKEDYYNEVVHSPGAVEIHPVLRTYYKRWPAMKHQLGLMEDKIEALDVELESLDPADPDFASRADEIRRERQMVLDGVQGIRSEADAMSARVKRVRRASDPNTTRIIRSWVDRQ